MFFVNVRLCSHLTHQLYSATLAEVLPLVYHAFDSEHAVVCVSFLLVAA